MGWNIIIFLLFWLEWSWKEQQMQTAPLILCGLVRAMKLEHCSVGLLWLTAVIPGPWWKDLGKSRWRPDDLGSPVGLNYTTLPWMTGSTGWAVLVLKDVWMIDSGWQKYFVFCINEVAPDHQVMFLWNKFTWRWLNITSKSKGWECPNAVLIMCFAKL